jgi:hypothetical protein
MDLVDEVSVLFFGVEFQRRLEVVAELPKLSQIVEQVAELCGFFEKFGAFVLRQLPKVIAGGAAFNFTEGFLLGR